MSEENGNGTAEKATTTTNSKTKRKSAKAKPQENPNMELWNKVCKTPDDVLCSVPVGSKITTIGTQFYYKRAAEVFGPEGEGWGTKEEDYKIIQGDGPSYCLFTAKLWRKGDEYTQISASITITSGKDWAKIVRADAIKRGLASLGFFSDVYEGRFNVEDAFQECKYFRAGEGINGPRITQEQVAELSSGLAEVDGNKDKFLEWLGVSCFEEVLAADYLKAKNAIAAKKKQQAL